MSERSQTRSQARAPSSRLLAREFHRRGPEHRGPEVISFLDIRRRFNFRAIEIGRWVTEPEKARTAGLFHDALCDLMTILGGPEHLVSLRGTLALQYGTGGQRGVAAHYVPASRTFALAKNAGPGSIAHEWFHAFDHYVCRKAFAAKGSSLFASAAWKANATPIAHPLNALLTRCFLAIFRDESGRQPSEMAVRAREQDKRLDICYYSQPEELCARAFEAFIQDAAIKNQFLVAGTLSSEETRLGLYPSGRHRMRINTAFKAYFSQLGHALKRAR